jgi:hypothetical protein
LLPVFGHSANRRPAIAASCLCALLCLPLLLAAPAGAAAKRDRSIRAVDFRNFTYRFEECDAKTLTLRDGFAGERLCFGVTKLVAVRYADFDADGSEEAVVTLGTNCHASCWYVEDYYVFGRRSGKIRQLFHTSSSFRYGLKPPADFSKDVFRLSSAYGLSLKRRRMTLTVPAWDSFDGNCCPRYHERAIYEWRRGRFGVVSRKRRLDPNGPGDPAAALMKR